MNTINSRGCPSENDSLGTVAIDRDLPNNVRSTTSTDLNVTMRREPAPKGTMGESVIGTLEQWVSLCESERYTIKLLDRRLKCGSSGDNIREFFSKGNGIKFPAWVRENFLGRIAIGSGNESPAPAGVELANNARSARVETAQAGESATVPTDSSEKAVPKQTLTSRARRSRGASEMYLPAPTLLLRSACCRGVKGKNYKRKKYTPIAALDGIYLQGKGRLLSALDLIPWLGAMKLVRTKKTTGVVKIKLGALLKTIDRTDGTRSRQLLKKQLKRIAKFKIKLDAIWGTKHTVYVGPLLCNFKMLKSKSGKRNEFECSVSSELLGVFEAGETYLRLRDIKLLMLRPLCLWLWGFYCGHDRPHAMFVKTIQRLAGFEGPTFEFRRQLKEGLKFLKKQNLIAEWAVGNADKITVIHLPRGNKSAHTNSASIEVKSD